MKPKNPLPKSNVLPLGAMPSDKPSGIHDDKLCKCGSTEGCRRCRPEMFGLSNLCQKCWRPECICFTQDLSEKDCKHLEIEEVTLYDCPPDEVTFCLDCGKEWRPENG